MVRYNDLAVEHIIHALQRVVLRIRQGGHAGLDSGLGHGIGDQGDQALVHWLRNDVLTAEFQLGATVAAANALRELAKLPVPQDVCDAYGGAPLSFGREYIIPKPMDKRLITLISDAVAKAAIKRPRSMARPLPWPPPPWR